MHGECNVKFRMTISWMPWIIVILWSAPWGWQLGCRNICRGCKICFVSNDCALVGLTVTYDRMHGTCNIKFCSCVSYSSLNKLRLCRSKSSGCRVTTFSCHSAALAVSMDMDPGPSNPSTSAQPPAKTLKMGQRSNPETLVTQQKSDAV